MKITLLLIVLLSVTLILGCTGDGVNQKAKTECIQACNDALSAGQDLSSGPCLLNPMSNPDWVCDIAHSPRQEIDEDPANQCLEFANGDADHFVELSPTCEIIKVY